MKKALPYIAILTALTFWGISYISATVCIRYISPTVLASARCLLGAILLIIIWKISDFSKNYKRIDKKDLFRFIISGFFGMNSYFICEMSALKYISAPIASIIVAAIPMFALIVNRVLYKNKLTVFKIVGVILSMIGVALIISSDLLNISSSSKAIGYFLMLGAVFSWVAFNFLSKPLHKKYPSLTITTFQMIFAAITMLPMLIFGAKPYIPLDTVFIVNFLFLAILCSATGILLYMYSLGKLGVLTNTLFINFQPFITVIASAFILKVFLTPLQMLGGVIVVVAVYISSIMIKPKYKELI